MKVRAVLLDAGETIITPRRPLPDELAEAVPGGAALPVAEVRRHFEAVWTERGAGLAPGQDRFRTVPGGSLQYWSEVLCETFRRVGSPLPMDACERLYARLCEPGAWRIFPEVEDTLDELRRRGFRLAIASNWDRGLPAILEGLRLSSRFEVLGVSEVVGHEKPGVAFFEAVLSALGVGPEEAVHVGDRVHDDLEGARAAGLHALLIDRFERFEAAPHVIRSLAELPARLASV